MDGIIQGRYLLTFLLKSRLKYFSFLTRCTQNQEMEQTYNCVNTEISTQKRYRIKDKGYILIDAMISMVILVFGVLALLNLQARLVLNNQLSQVRTQASLFASQLLSAASADTGNASCYVVPINNQNGCASAVAANYTNNWLAAVLAAMPTSNNNPPTATLNADGTMVVTIWWRLNQENVFHRFTVRGQVQ